MTWTRCGRAFALLIFYHIGCFYVSWGLACEKALQCGRGGRAAQCACSTLAIVRFYFPDFGRRAYVFALIMTTGLGLRFGWTRTSACSKPLLFVCWLLWFRKLGCKLVEDPVSLTRLIAF